MGVMVVVLTTVVGMLVTVVMKVASVVVVLTTVVGMVVTVVMKFWASDWILVMQKIIKGRKDKHTLGSYHTSCDKDNCKGTSN